MIYLLTYDRPHRKTQDLLYLFKLSGANLHVLITPWVERKNFVALFKVKPDPWPWYPSEICEKLGYKYSKISSELRVGADKFDEKKGLLGENSEFSCVLDSDLCGEIVVIAGAGILGESFVKSNTVLNSHCGWLPKVRGLDALKWAIYYGHEIGVTTHVVDETCDGGLLIEQKEVPLYPQDNIYSIAMRQYEMEISMLVDAVVSKKYENTTEFGVPGYDPKRRMKHRTELQMAERLHQRLTQLNIN